MYGNFSLVFQVTLWSTIGMGKELRKRKDGSTYWTFLIYDARSKKNLRVPQSQVPAWVASEETAEEFFRSKQAEFETTRLRIAKQQAWKARHYDFVNLLKVYEIERRRNAPRSWANDVYWLETYAFPFFLKQSGGNNINNWPEYFDAFREHLEIVPPAKVSQPKLAYNSMNKIIKALNTFLAEMQRKKLATQLPKMQAFESKYLRKIDLHDIYKESEIEPLYQALLTDHQDSAEFFLFLARTGQRINEGLGASLESLKKERPASKIICKWLDEYEIPCVGYIYLDSQLLRPGAENKGVILRGPLKGRPSINPRYARIIPIEEKRLYKILVRRHQEAARRSFRVRSEALLFPYLTRSIFMTRLSNACRQLGIRYRSPHMLRHYYATQLCGKIGGHNSLVQLILGHSHPKVTENYIHINEQLQEELQKDDAGQDLDYFD